MPKGFGNKRQTKEQYIKNFVRTSKQLLSGFETPEEAKHYYSKKWFAEFVDSSTDYSAEQLLNPTPQKLAIHMNPKVKREGIYKIALAGFNGIWRVMLLERPDKSLDLDIGVLAGSGYRFHSEVIKQSIIRHFGIRVYSEWRALVKSDIGSLKELIQLIQTQIDCVPWSYTCSQSSARLCQQVGVSTYRGAAFLFPASYR